MNIRTTLALTAFALSSTAAFATAPSTAERPLTLAQVVSLMESRYPGEVVAVEFDSSGDKPAHYHVDMRFPASGLARVDVDAATLAIASRDPTALTAGAVTLADAAALVAAQIPGQVVVAELDAFDGVAAHYDVDVRLPQGWIARLKVDPATRRIDWRSPAVVHD